MRLIIVLSLLLGLSPQDGEQELDQVLEKEAPACVLVRGEARYLGLGYTMSYIAAAGFFGPHKVSGIFVVEHLAEHLS